MRDHWAFLAATFMNGLNAVAGMFSKRKPKQVKPEDFLNDDLKKRAQKIIKEAQPEKTETDWASHIEDAKQKCLIGPW